MLVFSRKKNQTIRIGGHIQVQVLSMKNGSVRIGISAPQTVTILRSELVDPDIQALESDWATIGDDFASGIDEYVRRLESHVSSEESAQRLETAGKPG